VHLADALQVDEMNLVNQAIPDVIRSGEKIDVVIAGNLPFGIGTALLLKWLHSIPSRTGVYREDYNIRLVLMLQREVVDRIIAPVNTKEYSRLSVMSQHLCHAHRLFDVKGKSFVPPAKVDGSIVELVPKWRKIANSDDRYIYEPFFTSEIGRADPTRATSVLHSVLRLLFNNKRKPVAKTIHSKFGLSLQTMAQQLSIHPTTRPQEMELKQWALLVDAILTALPLITDHDILLMHENNSALPRKRDAPR
jgi:16S rRNA A1518/A1519 N6-dimethyltransferase RsmA/KsgA/DIM1 with predicted DNA glycosylase/AP lyase activity